MNESWDLASPPDLAKADDITTNLEKEIIERTSSIITSTMQSLLCVTLRFLVCLIER